MSEYPSRSAEGDAAGWPALLHDIVRAGRLAPGMHLFTASDGPQAPDIPAGRTAAHPHFDPALVDMHTLQMDGDPVRAVRGGRKHPGLKMVLLSSMASHDDVRVAYETGDDRFVAKPFRKSELRQVALALSAGRPDVPRLTPRLNAHILVPEDNIVNQEVIGQMLRVLGCRVRGCSSGLARLRALCEARFDPVLMDIQMPAMDGLEALSWFRQGKTRGFLSITLTTTPVIAVTANALEAMKDASWGLDSMAICANRFANVKSLPC